MEKLTIKELDTKIKVFAIDKDYLSRLEKEHYSEDEKVMEMRRALEYHIAINIGVMERVFDKKLTARELKSICQSSLPGDLHSCKLFYAGLSTVGKVYWRGAEGSSPVLRSTPSA